jgi:hypothetical protein
MNKNILPILLTGTLLCGCGAATTAAPETSTETETSSETEVSGTTQSVFSTEASETDGTVATVQGPYGSVSLTIPEGWSYTICDVADDNLLSAEYAIQFSPEQEAVGYIEVGYHTMFGVCGTGLEEVDTTLAGESARIGYYDGSDEWYFVCFSGTHKGIVAIACENKDWEQTELDEVLNILDTLVYRADEKSGAIGVDACIRICQNYLSENDGDVVNTVTNWDNPSVTVVDELPDDYYQISDDTDSEKYFKVVFTTTADELLGSIDFFVDETGNIIGQNYRE